VLPATSRCSRLGGVCYVLLAAVELHVKAALLDGAACRDVGIDGARPILTARGVRQYRRTSELQSVGERPRLAEAS
jgi:hypothetical protein